MAAPDAAPWNCYSHCPVWREDDAKGGEEVTVTDANLVAGVLHADTFLGGRMKLDSAKAEKVLEEKIARPLKLDLLEAADGIAGMMRAAGLTAKVSSIHVNGWFGEYDKLATTRLLFAERFGLELETANGEVVFAGDSPNDSPMFGYFPNGVGVANVRDFAADMDHLPRWITTASSGAGFVELARALISARQR